MPLYGCDCYAYALLATGYVDLVIESGLKVSLRSCHVFTTAVGNFWKLFAFD